MTKTKSTKRALLSSLLALIVCVTMLIGTTFAWFTDSVTSTNNVIKSGTLDVTMEWADGTKAVPADDSSDWTDASTGAIFKSELWEPGYTEVRHIKIANEGTLALKYQLNIIANGEVSELADVIDVYYVDPAVQVADRTALTDKNKLGTLTKVLSNISTTASGNLKATEKHTITLALKMQESAGNEYQDLAIGSDFSIQLLATQLTSESDSFNNQYDKLADYDGEISSAASLIAALNKGGTFKVLKDITLDESVSIPAGVTTALDMNGNDISIAMSKDDGDMIVNNGTLTIIGDDNTFITNTTTNGGALIDNKGTLTLKGGNYVGAPIGETGYPDYAVYSSGKLIIEDGTSIISDRGAMNVSGETVINGGEFEVTSAASSRSLTCHTVYASGSTLTINDGNFENNYTGVSGASVICPAGSTITVNGGNFRDAVDSTADFNNTANFQNYMGYGKPINVYGGTYDDSTVIKNVAAGYEAVLGTDGIYTVAMTQDTVNTVFADAKDGDTVVLGSGEYTIPDSAQGKALTIVGNGDTVVAAQDDGAAEGDCDYSFDGSTVTFENVTISTPAGASYPGYVRMNATYNNCTFTGNNYTLYGDSVFNNCTFNLNNGYVWTWGASTVEFNGCTFEDTTSGAAKAILVHNTVETVVTVKDCTFKATTSAQTWDKIPVAAVSIDPENGSPAATVKFEGTNTYSDAFYGLYQLKYAPEKDAVTVLVDGQEVDCPAMLEKHP